jgi:hypothetical protein
MHQLTCPPSHPDAHTHRLAHVSVSHTLFRVQSLSQVAITRACRGGRTQGRPAGACPVPLRLSMDMDVCLLACVRACLPRSPLGEVEQGFGGGGGGGGGIDPN